jgi:hypothetical protein
MANPGPNIVTTSLLHQPGEKNPDGIQLATASTDLLGFYGVTPVVQPTASSQAIATDAASVIVLANALRLALVNLGLIKGS